MKVLIYYLLMKKNLLFFNVKYPKFLLLGITLFFAIVIFSYQVIFSPIFLFLLSLGLFGIFLTGILYSYSFTSIPATAVLIILGKSSSSYEYNLILIAIIAGLGAVIGDLIVFKFIRHSFEDEIDKFCNEKVIIYIKNRTNRLVKKYFMLVIGFIIISSPLPDEIGVFLVAEFTEISTKFFTLLSFVLNTCGILFILILSNSI